MSSSSTQGRNSEREIDAIDTLFERAGLVRNPRGKAAGVTGRMRLERADKEELIPVAPVPRAARNGVEWLTVANWEKASWLWHGFSTRRGGHSRAYCGDDAPGELNLGFTADDDRETVVQNRRLLTEAVSGDAATPIVTVRQIHSNLVVLTDLADAGHEPLNKSSLPACKGDGLMTDKPGLLLGIQTADCIPVLVADPKRRAVAAFHAGWRGTVERIVESGIGRMRLAFGSRPEDLIAAIGPGIGACCYAVGEEVLSEFESQFTYARELFREVYDSDPVRTRYPMLFLTQRAPGHSPIGPSLHLDLVEANRRQLLSAGLKARSINLVGGCTSCQSELFFSHRASGGHAGRMLSVIGIKETDGVRKGVRR
ncbi:MAG: peptidoglycan editing factor PgeF [Terracidiphilus sp.]|jgi:YfiH family protein